MTKDEKLLNSYLDQLHKQDYEDILSKLTPQLVYRVAWGRDSIGIYDEVRPPLHNTNLYPDRTLKLFSRADLASEYYRRF